MPIGINPKCFNEDFAIPGKISDKQKMAAEAVISCFQFCIISENENQVTIDNGVRFGLCIAGKKEVETMPVLTDMHAHLSCIQELEDRKIGRTKAQERGAEELLFRQSSGIRTFVSTGRPCEWELLQELLRESSALYRKAHSGGQTETQGIRMEAGGITAMDSARQILPDFVRMSFGIHPWYADQFEPADCPEAFRVCDAVGEIGMDSVWCGAPLSVQRRRFMQQLQIAADLQKPVVLHTKGCETEIAELLHDFPGKILIHWFSGTRAQLEKFLELDCYFTLGPDLSQAVCPYGRYGENEIAGEFSAVSGMRGREETCAADARREAETCAADARREAETCAADARREAETCAADARCKAEAGPDAPESLAKAELYQAMLREIPENRLFLETDGRSSVEWALGRPVKEAEIPEILSANLRTAAAAKKLSGTAFARILEGNFSRFLTRRCRQI